MSSKTDELIAEARKAVLNMDYSRAYQGGLVGRLADALESAGRLVGEPTDEQAVERAIEAYEAHSTACYRVTERVCSECGYAFWTPGSAEIPTGRRERHAMRAALTAAGVAPQAPSAPEVYEEVTRELDRIFGVQAAPPLYDVDKIAGVMNAADVDYSAREQRADAGGGDKEPGDWFTFIARAVVANLEGEGK